MTAFARLPEVKKWLSLTTSTDDDLLRRLIGSASGYVSGWLNREIVLSNYTETRDGNDAQRMTLSNYPVISVSAVWINDMEIPAKVSSAGFGFTWNFSQVVLDGYRFNRGVDNVQIVYRAGFRTTQALIIPATPPYQVITTALWTEDDGVTIGSTVLTSTTGTPAAGQYSVTDGVYQFNVAQAGLTANVSYGYIPLEIEQATIDIIGRKYRERDRIGLESKGLAGETTRYTQSDMSDDTKSMLNQFRKVIPI